MINISSTRPNLYEIILFIKHYSGLEEAVFRNINACNELAKTVRSAYGPNGNFFFFHLNVT